MIRLATMAALAAAGFLAAAAAGAGDMYFWTDENGVKHYSTSPPPVHVEEFKKTDLIPYDAEADRKRAQREAEFERQERIRRERAAAKEASRERYEERREQIERLEKARTAPENEPAPGRKDKTAAQRKRVIGY